MIIRMLVKQRPRPVLIGMPRALRGVVFQLKAAREWFERLTLFEASRTRILVPHAVVEPTRRSGR